MPLKDQRNIQTTGMFSDLIVIEPSHMPTNRSGISHALSIRVEETEVGDPDVSGAWTHIQTVRLRS